MPNNAGEGILEDSAGKQWLSTGSGLSRFDPRTRTFKNYYSEDGLPGDESRESVYYKSARGEMFFGGVNGVAAFYPEKVVDSSFVPPVVLTDFRLFNKPVPIGSRSPLKKSIAYTDSLALSYDQKMFSFEFAALSYVDPARNEYRYMLGPLDHSWNQVDSDHRVATFTTLPTGRYTPRVQGSNNRGVWNEQGAALHLQILPPYWGTWWFRASCVAAFFALLWALYRYRLYQIKQEFNARLEERVGERTRIARELHDTLLQSFQGSLIVMQAARNLLSRRPEKAGETLDNAINMASGAVAEGRDAIHDLRLQPAVQSDLAQLLTATGQDLAHSEDANGNPVIFRVAVEGERQAFGSDHPGRGLPHRPRIAAKCFPARTGKPDRS